jgi:hypothetical protein
MVRAIDAVRPRLSRVALAAGLAAVAVAHATCVFVGYRSRIVLHSPAASSDLLLFALPALLALGSYYALLYARRVQSFPRWIAAFLLASVSFCLSLLLPFNIYGT